jgi:hypothetical protein
VKLGLSLMCVVVLAGGPARADAQEDESRANLEGPHGMAVTIGLGEMDFLGRARDSLTEDVGLYADLRVIYGTRTRFGGEVAFTRSQHHVLAGVLPGSARTLFGQGFEALLRINHPGHAGRLFFSPFAVAGLGWTDFTPPGDRDPMTRNRRLDRAGTVPLGAGFAASFGNFYGEARLMYRPTFAADLLGSEGARTSMQAWFAGLAAGIEI